MAKNQKTDGQNVPVEGRAGDTTHSAFIEGLHGKHGGSEESEGSPQEENSDRPIAGHHRLPAPAEGELEPGMCGGVRAVRPSRHQWPC